MASSAHGYSGYGRSNSTCTWRPPVAQGAGSLAGLNLIRAQEEADGDGQTCRAPRWPGCRARAPSRVDTCPPRQPGSKCAPTEPACMQPASCARMWRAAGVGQQGMSSQGQAGELHGCALGPPVCGRPHAGRRQGARQPCAEHSAAARPRARHAPGRAARPRRRPGAGARPRARRRRPPGPPPPPARPG